MTDSIQPQIGGPLGSTARLKQRRAFATHATILSAFAISFDTAGYAATTMNDVITPHSIAKGTVYFHFASKEAIAQQLIGEWNNAAAQSVSYAAATGGSITEQLRTVFAALSAHIKNDRNIRAGFKLTLDPSIDGAHDSYRRWIDTISDLVEAGIRSGAINDTTANRRLGWNLCSGFVGAVHSVSILREDLDLTTHTSELLSAHLPSATTGTAIDGHI